MTKKATIWLVSLIAFVVLLGGAVLIYYFGASYPTYASLSRGEFKIPGLNEDFVPQGMCYLESENLWLVSGYVNKSGEKSRIYAVNGQTNTVSKYVNIDMNEDKYVYGHFGGIACHGDYIYLANEGKINQLAIADLMSAETKSALPVLASFDTHTGADFIFATDDALWVGDFYREGNYETDKARHVKISDKETNKALVLKYGFAENRPNGAPDLVPSLAISLPNQVQGFSITSQNQIILSTSYSIPDSIIYVYNAPHTLESMPNITLPVGEIPLLVCSSQNLIKRISAPAMSEGIDLKDDRVYILFESACSKYALVNRTRSTFVTSIALSDLITANN